MFSNHTFYYKITKDEAEADIELQHDVHVSCSSQVDAQLAAFFIDPRAKLVRRPTLESAA
jgi:hypothetical protein